MTKKSFTHSSLDDEERNLAHVETIKVAKASFQTTAAVFTDVTAQNTLIPKKYTKKTCDRGFLCQKLLRKKFGNSRRETQVRKPLKNKTYEAWFNDEKTRLHMVEVSFLIAIAAKCKRNLS